MYIQDGDLTLIDVLFEMIVYSENNKYCKIRDSAKPPQTLPE